MFQTCHRRTLREHCYEHSELERSKPNSFTVFSPKSKPQGWLNPQGAGLAGLKARPQGFHFYLKKLDLVSPSPPTSQAYRFILTLPHCIFLGRRRTGLGCRKPPLEDSESYGQSNALRPGHCAVLTRASGRLPAICLIITSPNKRL